MGNANTKNEETEHRFRSILASLQHIRKEHNENINWDVDLYRPVNPEFEESLLILVEIPLDESYNESKSAQQIVDEFIDRIKSRQMIKCPHLTHLTSHFLILQKRFCAEFPVGELFLEYSDETLLKQINDKHALYKSGVSSAEIPPPYQVFDFMQALSDALQVLSVKNQLHGYVMPANVLIYNNASNKPLYKLFDVGLLSKHPNCYERMMIDKNYFAPLDARLLQAYQTKNYSLTYETSDDVWGLGITALCFIFKEDFNSFYDWSRCRIRKDKIDNCLQILSKMNYNKLLVKLLTEMVDLNSITRLKLSLVCENLRQKSSYL